ncbi:MAG TPA: hypothetical protein VMU00_08360 [Steroidobacteraceae bacterium]|nr:hypothetical protein [Steroidobacteraceae bacterium]
MGDASDLDSNHRTAGARVTPQHADRGGPAARRALPGRPSLQPRLHSGLVALGRLIACAAAAALLYGLVRRFGAGILMAPVAAGAAYELIDLLRHRTAGTPASRPRLRRSVWLPAAAIAALTALLFIGAGYENRAHRRAGDVVVPPILRSAAQ